jgi:hypothetical protein
MRYEPTADADLGEVVDEPTADANLGLKAPHK